MALANIASLMVKWGNKVLIVDWDLEAPGLELFFKQKNAPLKNTRKETPGIIDLLYTKKKGRTLDWHECLLDATVFGKSLSIITAGKNNNDYQKNVQNLNWAELFEDHNIGNYLDELRNEWKSEYDFILIDSRTGINDIGDVCTVLLPDVLVLLFVTNLQNIEGIKEVMTRATKAHKNLPVNRSRLIGVPVPCRDEVYNEYEKSQKWKRFFEKHLGVYYDKWLPENFSPKDALNKLFIPYVANWSFGERLPVVENEDEINNPASISAAYARLTTLLVNRLDWNKLEALSDPHELSQAKSEILNAKIEADKAITKSKLLIKLSISIAVAFATGVFLFYIVDTRRQRRETNEARMYAMEQVREAEVKIQKLRAREAEIAKMKATTNETKFEFNDWYSKGAGESLGGKYEKAIGSFTKALENTPSDSSKAFTLNYRGVAYMRLVENEKALSDFNESTKLKPNNPRPYHNRTLIYYNSKDYKRAFEEFKEAIKLYNIDGEDVTAFNFSLKLSKLFKQVKGEEEIKTYIEEKTNELGQRLIKQGKVVELPSED
jgi:tetratricopeptide (TPR) repeat protein